MHLLRCSRNFSVQFAQIITVFYLIINEQITISCFRFVSWHVCQSILDASSTYANLSYSQTYYIAFCTERMSSRKVSEFERMSSCFSFRFPCCGYIIPWIIDFSQKYEFFRIIGDSKNHMRKSFSKIILWVVFLETYWKINVLLKNKHPTNTCSYWKQSPLKDKLRKINQTYSQPI